MQTLPQERASPETTRNSTTSLPPPAIAVEKPEPTKQSDLSETRRKLPAQRVAAVEQSSTVTHPPKVDAAMLEASTSGTVAAGLQPAASSGGLDQVRKGETTQGDLIRLFGGPNLTAVDETGRETWIYERTQTQTDVHSSSKVAQATARLGLFFGSVAVGGAADKAGSTQTMTTTSAVRSVTVIVKFAPDRTVYDYSVRETYF
jgi:hypothetical protein